LIIAKLPPFRAVILLSHPKSELLSNVNGLGNYCTYTSATEIALQKYTQAKTFTDVLLVCILDVQAIP